MHQRLLLKEVCELSSPGLINSNDLTYLSRWLAYMCHLFWTGWPVIENALKLGIREIPLPKSESYLSHLHEACREITVFGSNEFIIANCTEGVMEGRRWLTIPQLNAPETDVTF